MDDSQSGEGLTGGVLEPMALEEFFEHYWEAQPLHIARKSSNPFERLIDAQSIETLLSTNDLFYPSVQLSQSGKTISSSEYTDNNDKIVSARVIDGYHHGATIVLSHAHKLRSELMNLCRRIQSSFMMRCQTNVYLSPAGNQGFNPHFDTHDVFILQVSGKKTFNFYAGGAKFPTRADRFNKEVHTVGEKTESIELSAGDTLYIPRGFVHDAVADKSEPSLHITLGVYPISMQDLMQELMQLAVESDEHLRRAIPQPLWMKSASPAKSAEQLARVMQTHINTDSVTTALSRLRDEMALDMSPNVVQRLDSTPGKSIGLETEFVLNHSKLLHIERTANTVKLRTFGAVVEFNDPYGVAVEWLVEQAGTRVENIPGLNNSQRIALVEQLTHVDVIGMR